MMVKSGLEFFILKFSKPLQRYLLTCQANSAFMGRIGHKFGIKKVLNMDNLFILTFSDTVMVEPVDRAHGKEDLHLVKQAHGLIQL